MIDHTPTRVDHTGLVAGLPWDIVWEFGPEETPENLTGKIVRLVVNGVNVTPERNDVQGSIRYRPTAGQTAAFVRRTIQTLLIIDNVPEAMGVLTIARRIAP